MSIRILIAEDHLIARVGLIALISIQSDMTVVAEATNGQQAIDLYREHIPDVAVIDIRMPVRSGIEAITAIRKEFRRAKLIALSTYIADEDIQRALQAGAQAYLTKDVLQHELENAIRTVYDGRNYLPPSVAAIVAANLPRPELSAREVEVLELMVQGLHNKQIGYELNISEHTVKNHVKRILEKLPADDRTQAVRIAIHRGIVHLS